MRNSKRSAGKTKKGLRRVSPLTRGRAGVSVQELSAAMADALEDILRYERNRTAGLVR